MFRGKESSNRIKLSQLVQELLNFGVLGSLQLGGGGWVDGGGGWLGGAPYTCAHAHAHTHTHTCVVNMIISCKWRPRLGEYLGIPYDVIRACMRVCVCVHVRACVHVHVHTGEMHPLTTPTPIHPPPTPRGGPPESFKIQ